MSKCQCGMLACRCRVFSGPHDGFRDSYIQNQFDELKDLIKKYLEPRTIKINPEPEVKTCEHEPDYPLIQEYQPRGHGYIHISDVQRMVDVYRSPKCKCGAYIKQEGKWVVV